MANFTELIGQTVGIIIDAETAIVSYTPQVNGRLKSVSVLAGGIAATSLIESGYVRLRCSTFGGVDMVAYFEGVGLETVPRAQKVVSTTKCDLAIKSGVPINILYYYNVLPTTPELFIFAEIEA